MVVDVVVVDGVVDGVVVGGVVRLVGFVAGHVLEPSKQTEPRNYINHSQLLNFDFQCLLMCPTSPTTTSYKGIVHFYGLYRISLSSNVFLVQEVG